MRSISRTKECEISVRFVRCSDGQVVFTQPVRYVQRMVSHNFPHHIVCFCAFRETVSWKFSLRQMTCSVVAQFVPYFFLDKCLVVRTSLEVNCVVAIRFLLGSESGRNLVSVQGLLICCHHKVQLFNRKLNITDLWHIIIGLTCSWTTVGIFVIAPAGFVYRFNTVVSQYIKHI